MSLLKRYSYIIALYSFVGSSLANADIFRLRKNIYNPRCAHACRAAIQTSQLECTSNVTHTTSTQCFATNDAYLQTLAHCIEAHCQDSISDLEQFWDHYVVGWDLSSPTPKYSYETAVSLAGDPSNVLLYGKEFDNVYNVGENDYIIAYASLADWNEAEEYHTRFALAIFLTGFLAPVLLSLLRFIPASSSLTSRYRAVFIYPSLWSRHWSVLTRDVGDLNQTRGQGLFILYMVIINAVLSSTGHFAFDYHFWSFDGRHGQFITCLANRFGALSLANIPLLFLYSGRNNILLKITNWSHATFLVLHRWLAYIAITEAILHSFLYLHVAVVEDKHTAWVKVPAWYLGSMATIAMSLLAPLSIVYIRRGAYELFLTSHIVVSVVVIVGAFYHVSDLFDTKTSGYVLYVLMSIFFWLFDRLGRMVRLALNGVSKATVAIVDEDYIRVDIPNVKGSGHAYLYFPTLTVRFWENHPFSIATSHSRMLGGSYLNTPLRSPPDVGEMRIGLDPRTFSLSSSSDKSSPTIDVKSIKSFDSKDYPSSPTSLKTPITPITPMSAFPLFSPSLSEKSLLSPTSSTNLILSPAEKPLPPKPQGLTFFMRTHGGTTALLRKRTSLPVLVEASYGQPKDITEYPILICVAGGVGITAILPYLHAHRGTTKLYWGSRSQALVNALRDEVRGYNGEISVGRRLFIKLALQREFGRVNQSAPVAVVVNGPKGMADDVREFCCEVAMKRTGEVRFLNESFGW